MTQLHNPQPPQPLGAHWVPGLVPIATAKPLLLLPPAHGRAGIAAPAAGSDMRCLKDLWWWWGGGLYLRNQGAGARSCPRTSWRSPHPAQGGAGASQGCPPTLLWGPPQLEESSSPPMVPSPRQTGPVGCWWPPPSRAAAAGEQQDLLQGCRGAEPQHPAAAGEHPAEHPHPPRAMAGLWYPGCGGASCTHSITPSPGGTQQAVGVQRAAPARSRYLVGSPGDTASGCHGPPTPLSGPWHPRPHLAHRGGRELEAWAGGGGRRVSADAAGERGVGEGPPAVCVSRPAPAAECTTKTTIAPKPPRPTPLVMVTSQV